MTGIKYSGVDMEANLLHMNNPSIGFVNSADCVDMPCDAKKKVLITDLDGTTLGKVRVLFVDLLAVEPANRFFLIIRDIFEESELFYFRPS